MRIDDSDLPLLSGSGGQRRGKSVSPVADEACRFPWVSPVADLRTADQKSAGASDTLEAPVMIGGPSRTRTLDPLIKSHFGQAASDTIAQNPLRSRGWNALGRSRFCALLDAAFAPALTRSHPL